ncbi:hypothetical protein [Streptomyces sp. NPDC059009]|uniref:hypothetical protein n=1 Tax=Streptomyces sp. NPDC059009 TaxID=3346694 RepID=UPI0036877D2C
MAANRKLLAVAVACAAAVVGVTGCSSDGDKDPFEGMSAKEIADKAADASKGAGSFRVTGEGKQADKSVKVDFSVAKSGDCTGKTDAGDKGVGELLVSGKTQYVKGDEAFWKNSMGSSAAAGKLAGKWVKTPNEKQEGTCSADQMFQSKKLKNVKREKDSDVNGKKAAVLTKNESGKKTTFYVAAEGKPYFLKVVTSDKEGPGTMYFTDYGKPVTVKAPPADQVADLKEVMSGS